MPAQLPAPSPSTETALSPLLEIIRSVFSVSASDGDAIAHFLLAKTSRGFVSVLDRLLNLLRIPQAAKTATAAAAVARC